MQYHVSARWLTFVLHCSDNTCSIEPTWECAEYQFYYQEHLCRFQPQNDKLRMTTCVLDVAFTFEVNKSEEAEAPENQCRAAFVCVSAKHFTVGPKMAEMRVVSPSWQGPLSVPAPPWSVCSLLFFSP